MPSPIKVPPLGESITEAIVSSWRADGPVPQWPDDPPEPAPEAAPAPAVHRPPTGPAAYSPPTDAPAHPGLTRPGPCRRWR